MSPLRSVTLIFVILYACSSIQSARGLKCYVCQGRCAVPGKDEEGDTPRLKDCPPAKTGQTIGCRTVTHYSNDVNNPDSINRDCESVDPAKKQELMKCRAIDQIGSEKPSTRCFCQTDGCNQNGCSCAKSSGSNIGVFSLWPLFAALNLLLIHLEMGSSSA